jgi:pyruvate/2-oxoacid:ferredoxin oxidoreductase alpha subunit
MIIEMNFSGQIEKLIRQETGLSVDHTLRKYDGEPFGPRQIEEAVKAVLAGKPIPAHVVPESQYVVGRAH